ncbi:MAG: condensation domain-containing protein, partial [Gordonia sp. (in: high G+C Gram-positive bacteria)]
AGSAQAPIVVCENGRDVTAAAIAARSRLNPESGAMVSAVWLDWDDEPGRLLLQIHHLVVDGVSWRVLVPELISAYQQLASGVSVTELSMPAAPTSFGGWARKLVELDRSAELSLWRELDGAALPGFFTRALDPALDRSGDTRVHRVSVDAAVAGKILGPAPARLGVAVDDALLGAFGAALDTPVLVDLESHGREEHLVPGADLTGTVGWFTAVAPVPVGGDRSATEQARDIAAWRGRAPDGGVGYGLLRYRDGADLPAAGIEFNYLGRYRSFEFGDWGMAPESSEIGPDDAMPAGYGLIVDVTTLDGPDGTRLDAIWRYQPGVVDETTVEGLAQRWLAGLAEITDSVNEGEL